MALQLLWSLQSGCIYTRDGAMSRLVGTRLSALRTAHRTHRCSRAGKGEETSPFPAEAHFLSLFLSLSLSLSLSLFLCHSDFSTDPRGAIDTRRADKNLSRGFCSVIPFSLGRSSRIRDSSPSCCARAGRKNVFPLSLSLSLSFFRALHHPARLPLDKTTRCGTCRFT